MNRKHVLLAAGAIALAAPAFASDQPGVAGNAWKEEGSGGVNYTGAIPTDAGQYPIGYVTTDKANATRGEGPLNTITGTLTFTQDVDMFCIAITDPAGFSALVSGNGFAGSPNIALFDTQGHGIAFNDNNPANNSSTQSRLTNLFTASQPAGLYFIAVSRNDGSVLNYPFNAAATTMFPTSPANVEYGPINPTDVLTSWQNPGGGGGFQLSNFNYTITLTGAGFHQLPAPGAAGLLAMGGLVAMRRRRN